MHSFPRKIKTWFCFMFVSAYLLCAAGAWGQAGATGSVQGTVTDPTNAIVVDAAVTLTDVATNAERTAVTNDAGRYIFPNVPPGVYDVSIAKTGFRTTKFVRQDVNVGTTLTLDAKLALGSTVET